MGEAFGHAPLPDGTIDRTLGSRVGRRETQTLSDGPLETGRVFPQPGGGFLVWEAGSSGSPNRIYRFNLELQQDGSYGGGDGFIETAEEFGIAADGGVVEFRHLNADTVRWMRYSPVGGVVLQVDRPAPHIGATAPDGNPYLPDTFDTPRHNRGAGRWLGTGRGEVAELPRHPQAQR